MSDTPPRPARQWLRAGLVLVAVAVLVRLLVPVDAPADVLTLPAAGSVRAAQLSDGTAVFLAHPDAVRVEVLEAVVDRGVGPVGAVVGWCPSVQQFVAPHHGLRWDAVGDALPVTLAGRVVDPDAPDLVRRGYERLDGRGEAEDPLRVEDPLGDDVPREAPPLAGSRSFSPPVTCRAGPSPLTVDGQVLPLTLTPHLLDHAFRAALLRLPRDGWQVTDGWLLVAPDATLTWCRVPPVEVPPTCPDPAPVPLSLGLTPEDTGGAWAVLGGPLAARVEEGVVTAVAVLPRSAWRGSSLHGAVSYTAEHARVDTGRSALLLNPTPRDGGPECLGPALRRPRAEIDPPVVQALDADTVLEVAGRHDPDAFVAAVPRAGATTERVGADVEVLVDLATCRALRVALR